jgi:hypothetical protein
MLSFSDRSSLSLNTLSADEILKNAYNRINAIIITKKTFLLNENMINPSIIFYESRSMLK